MNQPPAVGARAAGLRSAREHPNSGHSWRDHQQRGDSLIETETVSEAIRPPLYTASILFDAMLTV
jgi:hypothetical protein